MAGFFRARSDVRASLGVELARGKGRDVWGERDCRICVAPLLDPAYLVCGLCFGGAIGLDAVMWGSFCTQVVFVNWRNGAEVCLLAWFVVS
ncbi:hypothetical protein K227x_50360 [Rubripirellula lacrimiformis]|uniref:Uncharacterized protein n=1 Tax=Rubripirellula lacrimiformis TaxID=1930273 RepID=A0A517NHK8_9BACT|nr:hypothetical protein K227x_50360 [Rubripirellula lacrimiformis]